MNYIDALALDIYRRSGEAGTPDKEDMPLYRFYALLALTTGEATTNEHVHDAWAAFTATDFPIHRSLIPFGDLKPEVQELDAPYRDAIRGAARARRLKEKDAA